jgi:hypothetical protein
MELPPRLPTKNAVNYLHHVRARRENKGRVASSLLSRAALPPRALHSSLSSLRPTRRLDFSSYAVWGLRRTRPQRLERAGAGQCGVPSAMKRGVHREPPEGGGKRGGTGARWQPGCVDARESRLGSAAAEPGWR